MPRMPSAGPLDDHAPAPAAPGVRLWMEAQAEFRRRDYAAAAARLAVVVGEHLDAPGLREATVRLQYGVVLLRLGRTEDGVAQLRRAVELDPSNARAHHKLGAGLARLGLEAEALPWFERAVELAPAVAEHHWRLGEQYRRLGRRAPALASLERALELDPGYEPTRESLRKLQSGRASWLGRLKRRFGGP